MDLNEFDHQMMLKAIALSQEARLDAPPNPWVGCVIEKNGQVIGEGFTQPPGSAHAEVMALRQAGIHANGATLYVTLEPCSHYGRTPPCTKAIIEAGISRVVVGIGDPDNKVNGKGIQQLKEAGIQVQWGVEKERIENSLAPYLYHRKTGLPFCIAKAAISIDGRIAAQNGSSKWISSPEARAHAHQLRAESQAIMVGAGTGLADLPNLTVRDVVKKPLRPPLRVVMDRSGKIFPPSPLFDITIAPTLIVTSSACPASTRKMWEDLGVETFIATDLIEALEFLGKRGVLQVLVEGGGSLLGSCLRENLIKVFYLYMGNCVLGDQGIPLFKGLDIPSIEKAPHLQFDKAKILGSSLMIEITQSSLFDA